MSELDRMLDGSELDRILGGIESKCPSLKRGSYSLTSLKDRTYNCVAWALLENRRWWQPPDEEGVSAKHGTYWPTGAPEGTSVADYAGMFEMCGYEECKDGALEPGFEKIAIFAVVPWRFEHVARQLEDGRWASKLGPAEDIEHKTLADLEDTEYGTVVLFMKRAARSDA